MKAAIVYLVKDLSSVLVQSLQDLQRYFLSNFSYPVIIFHEELTQEDQTQLNQLITSTISYVQLSPFKERVFSQDFVDAAQVKRWCEGQEGGRKAPLGYREMCRFFSYELYHHPALADYDYYWRFDDDSFLYGPINEDPFAYMAEHDLIYGWRLAEWENPRELVGINELWKSTKNFAKKEHLPTRHLKKLCANWKGRYTGFNFYNNFEINKISFWRAHPLYKRYFDYLDRKELGFYKYRWGDANVRALSVGLFLKPNQVHHFKDIAYRHNDHYAIPGGDRIIFSKEGNPFEMVGLAS